MEGTESDGKTLHFSFSLESQVLLGGMVVGEELSGRILSLPWSWVGSPWDRQ